MSCPKLMEKLCSQLEIFDFFYRYSIQKNGAIVEKRGILCLPYFLIEFGDLTSFWVFTFCIS